MSDDKFNCPDCDGHGGYYFYRQGEGDSFSNPEGGYWLRCLMCEGSGHVDIETESEEASE